MADVATSLHKFEVAIDLINEVQRKDKEDCARHDINDKISPKDEHFAKSQEKAIVSARKINQTGMSITPGQVREMMKKFNIFDRNRDRGLDIDEMASVLRALGQNPTKTQLRAIMKQADKDGNGRVDEEEYVELLMSHMQTEEEIEEELMEAFKVFDKNNDGKVDTQELIRALQMCGEPLTQDEAQQLMGLMDKNGDGYIDLKEFVNFLCKGERNNPSKIMNDRRNKKR